MEVRNTYRGIPGLGPSTLNHAVVFANHFADLFLDIRAGISKLDSEQSSGPSFP